MSLTTLKYDKVNVKSLLFCVSVLRPENVLFDFFSANAEQQQRSSINQNPVFVMHFTTSLLYPVREPRWRWIKAGSIF